MTKASISPNLHIVTDKKVKFTDLGLAICRLFLFVYCSTLSLHLLQECSFFSKTHINEQSNAKSSRNSTIKR